MKDFLNRASRAYYEGDPIITDAEFDLLSERHSYNRVGYDITNGLKHAYPMFSLQKCFSLDDAPFAVVEDYVVSSPKLDGAAVSLLYINGNLELALTRGDGIQGADITEKMSQLVPTEIDRTSMVQITGEVVAPKSIENSRNYASGSLGLKSLKEFKTRSLAFIGYEVIPNSHARWSEEMVWMMSQGFRTVILGNLDEFPTDGTVFRYNDYTAFYKAGFTSHHPRAAFALKERKEGQITTLLDVVWQVGKSGIVSPVAILEPVNIDGAMVGRATLHNIKYIEDLGLEIGCAVEVIRSGEIIPRVVRRV